ncbi:MAG TPA: hypothetical protein VGV09_13125 [Steroidobacteraceae bacterium]|nr:hypothetical protein [Steroidobacteraceae bacterium]
MSGSNVLFDAHVELLQLFLAHRDEVIEKIQELLNAQRKPVEYLQDGPLLARHFEACFFAPTAVTAEQARLRGQLQQAHWDSGFRPRDMPGVHNDLVDPGQMMVRGFHMWRQTRWPGRNGRARFAHTLFNLYVLRSLELLSMRLWDAGHGSAAERLSRIQDLLDRLWNSNPADQPVLLRDARWLFPLAQSPTTEELAPYFRVAEQITESLPEADRLEIHKASVLMAGGHLRSQLRHYCMKQGVALNENSLVLSSRNSNALDFALTIQGLVPLLAAYEQAIERGDRDRRLELAGAICQGISADPELFVNRVELLGAYSMIEQLFTTTDDAAQVVYTPMGRRHVRLLHEYGELIGRLSKPLQQDLPHFRPVAGAYSPYALIYGFSSNVTEHIALKTLQPDTATGFSLEDVFVEGDAHSGKLAWVNGWRKLPHIKQEVQRLFDYPQQFAEDIFSRIQRALDASVSDTMSRPALKTGHLFVLSGAGAVTDSGAAAIPELPVKFVGSSDPEQVASHRAHVYDPIQLLRDRQEGMFLVSYQTHGGWVAITKDLLTEVLGAGQDVKTIGLPDAAAGVLRMMCPGLVICQQVSAGFRAT